LEERYAEKLRDKELEVSQLLVELDNASKASREEVCETLVRPGEGKKAFTIIETLSTLYPTICGL